MESQFAVHNPARRGHLNIAADFVADAWLPFDGATVATVQALLSGVSSPPISTSIVDAIKLDFSLLTFTALHLARKVNASASAQLLDTAPLDLIRQATPRELEAIMKSAAVNTTHPPLSEMQPEQGGRLRHAMISASAAEILAASVGIKKESAYTCALFRQIGIALIAWNYPHVYRRALTLVRDNVYLEDVIAKILGFSPAQLGIVIAQRWGLAPQVLRGMGDPTNYPSVKESDLVFGDRLKDICALSECVAQSTDPAAYPATAKRWPDIRATFEHRVGKGALTNLSDALAANCKVYLKVSPAQFQVPPEIEPPPVVRAGVVTRFEQNPFIERCPPHVQELFRPIYTALDGTRSDDAAKTLLQSVAPTLGFKSGCVFIYETESDLLKPRYTAGDRRPVDYPAVTAHNSGDPIAVTFLRASTRAPLEESGTLTGALGEARHAGVLRLAAGPELRGQPHAEVALLFEAFRKTLEDCLALY